MKILVIGDSCTDEYVYGACNRLSPEAPVPVMVPIRTTKNRGMAGNVFDNVKALNVDADILTNKKEIIKRRYVDEYTNQMFIRIDSGEDNVDNITLKALATVSFGQYDAIIISDYDKGFLTREQIRYVCENHPLVFVDTKKKLASWINRATFIKLNWLEYSNTILTLTPELESKLIITKGREGAFFRGCQYPVDGVAIKDVSGAGDTFLAALVVHYLETDNIIESIIMANKAATIVVQKIGVATL
jgi:D-beta-D-heptose 7-phosphate kinase/D-beta-D-heptose 1-phosphate adenosyltransferase